MYWLNNCKSVYTALLTVFLLSCTPSPETPNVLVAESPERTALPEQITVALVMKTLTNPFFIQMEAGARRAEKEFNINLVVKTAAQETSIQQQIDIVERLIDDSVDAIVIAPGDSIELIPSLARAQKAGIVVVNIDNKLDDSFAQRNDMEPIPFISVNNQKSAHAVTQYLISQLERPTNVAIIEGIKEAQNSQDRKEGALKAFNESELTTVVAMETAHWKIDEAFSVAQDIFELHPDIGAIFCANDMMGLGVLEYLSKSGRSDVLVASFDALDEALKAVASGELIATVDQKPAEQGYLGVQTALKMLRGEPVDIIRLIDAVVINKTTLTP
ncbi:substrate-binding domain-containing protein [Reinekea sp.]|jgi:ribose transport system substrate-binding protein|uniref:substrate-binding domain-containing protein n=1 Tax=Reinekea sp. TaxID=1970455 RepID=UPI002A7ECE1A|nr:substrate-binding domain-containing protein [Reinekea sp.]